MKNVKFIFLVLISILFIFPNITKAAITNYNGVVMTEEEYNNFLLVYEEKYVMHMNETKYNKLKSLDFSQIKKATRYSEMTYNPNLNLYTEKEITKEEFDNKEIVTSHKNSRLADDGTYYETQLKRTVLTLIGGTTWNYVVYDVIWKGIPSTRKFDVIGMRGYGFEFLNGSQSGEQIYNLNGNYTTIDYSWNGTNIVRFENGYGIAMNIVDTDISELNLTTEADIKPLINYPTIYASYQHATSSTTLAEAQNFTLGGSGLGMVFVYPYNISIKYDGMDGLFLDCW